MRPTQLVEVLCGEQSTSYLTSRDGRRRHLDYHSSSSRPRAQEVMVRSNRDNTYCSFLTGILPWTSENRRWREMVVLDNELDLACHEQLNRSEDKVRL